MYVPRVLTATQIASKPRNMELAQGAALQEEGNPMNDKTNSHVQQTVDTFKAVNAQQIQNMEKLFAEIDKLESRAVEQTNGMVSHLTEMARESVNTATRMSSAHSAAFSTMANPAAVGMSAAADQMNKLRDTSIDQARASVDELARLTQASMSYAVRMSAEWRKLTLETAKRTAEWMNNPV